MVERENIQPDLQIQTPRGQGFIGRRQTGQRITSFCIWDETRPVIVPVLIVKQMLNKVIWWLPENGGTGEELWIINIIHYSYMYHISWTDGTFHHETGVNVCNWSVCGTEGRTVPHIGASVLWSTPIAPLWWILSDVLPPSSVSYWLCG